MIKILFARVQGTRKVQGSRFKVMENLKFEEAQQFRSRSFWIFLGTIFLFLMGLFDYGFIKQIILGISFGTNPASDQEIIFITIMIYVVCIALILLFYLTKLTTLIDKDGIWIRYTPFLNRYKLIHWDQIKACISGNTIQ